MGSKWGTEYGRRVAVLPSLALALILVSTSAWAGLTRAQLDRVGVFPPPDAALPPTLIFDDLRGAKQTAARALAGVPAVVLFSDFACKTLCGPILSMTSAALAHSGMIPGRDYHLLIISLRANPNIGKARALVGAQLASTIARAARILIPDKPTLVSATQALGYHYLYDSEHDQFAHPTVAFVLGGSGKLSAVLSAPGLRGTDIRLALLNAGAGITKTFVDRLRLLCYCYDPETGIYTVAIGRLVDAAAALTLAALAGAIWLLRRKEVKRPA